MVRPDMTASGGESITQCSGHDNDWCCNADAQHVNCCKESPSPRPFFQLQDGKAYATVGSSTASSVPTISSITGLASGTGTAGSASQTSAAASSGGSSAGSRAVTADATSASASPYTSLSASVTSDAGGVRTVYNTLVITPTSDPTAAAGSSSTGSKSKSNLGLIIGCAVGIPLVLAFLGIAIWLLRKRRQQKAANPYKETSEIDDNSPNSPGFIGGAAGKLGKKQTFRSSRPGTAEIDGNPVGPGRPVSTVKGHAELESGSGFRPGQNAPYAPDTVGLGGGNGAERSTWGSVPPQYSPAHNQTGFTHNHNPEATELDGTTAMPVINEKAENEPQYIAYRPPQSQQPPPAELPTVKTPPEDLEKQIHHK
ncbi:hypothetical protein N0V83_007893 [Neocucurbitaria cava]|uniref:Uncharacterized protein n=1 Tax=Neocucurbitaria cava TaxID=798079 RepID=A0A9W9CK07_9PLEO|nr:hypothetical protein N0V83_007893 [Neocucurbitaria cava]